jgi:hypothetical protein
MVNSMAGLRILEHPKHLILKFFFGLQMSHRLAWFFCLESANKLEPVFVYDYGSIVATQIFKNLFS